MQGDKRPFPCNPPPAPNSPEKKEMFFWEGLIYTAPEKGRMAKSRSKPKEYELVHLLHANLRNPGEKAGIRDRRVRVRVRMRKLRRSVRRVLDKRWRNRQTHIGSAISLTGDARPPGSSTREGDQQRTMNEEHSLKQACRRRRAQDDGIGRSRVLARRLSKAVSRAERSRRSVPRPRPRPGRGRARPAGPDESGGS